jgi:nucleoid DNA-binding protein/nucleoid-associated protein YgaU
MSEKITFKELVELIAKQSEQSQASTNSFIGELVNIIESGLRDSGSVSISGFGKFELRWMDERPGVNPQTGEEITIPGQNKVVFKPYKSLREEVNRPYAKMKAQILEESPESKSRRDDSSSESGRTEEPQASTPKEKQAEKDDAEGFLIEHPVPKSPPESDTEDKSEDKPEGRPEGSSEGGKEKPKEESAERAVPPAPETPAPQKPKDAPAISVATPQAPADQAKMVKEVDKISQMNWSYAAAAIIVALAVLIIFLISQRSEITTETPSITQQEQVDEPAAPALESTDDAETGDDPQLRETEPPLPETETIQQVSVAPGSSLWTIAEAELGNPYLWPMIYHLNDEVIDNPNLIPANIELNVPVVPDPEQLSDQHLEQVALGYLSVYEWTKENNPDEARYFLWAVGVFSPDMLDLAEEQVDPADLAFARTR